MRISHRVLIAGIAAAGASAPALAGTAELTVTVPQLKVAEYHRPYVAIWLEQAGQPAIRTLAVWYDYDNRENGGTKWLRDLRSWWRKGGREAAKPADALTGATRAPGVQRVKLDLGALKPGSYTLVLEAAREEGGRELVSLPFNWNGKGAKAAAAGKTELGAISAIIKP
ncbi:MAG: DUF2271 domain-containing protein [Candidatus Andeanibacterium colombiense]|uniref:DUF2271 domain-containing protein n=1 Tax=Candidatus Andeanibacterium colombiense TaxID=3121345 RepID=A0AAJ5X679_9SPHN|nr:MAG: DUF2271 domain-containing protein [Sphingomonadaceae bacterium]